MHTFTFEESVGVIKGVLNMLPISDHAKQNWNADKYNKLDIKIDSDDAVDAHEAETVQLKVPTPGDISANSNTTIKEIPAIFMASLARETAGFE